MDSVRKFIQFNEKRLMLEMFIDFGEVTSLTWVTVNYLELKNIMKRREGEYVWEAVLSRKSNN